MDADTFQTHYRQAAKARALIGGFRHSLLTRDKTA